MNIKATTLHVLADAGLAEISMKNFSGGEVTKLPCSQLVSLLLTPRVKRGFKSLVLFAYVCGTANSCSLNSVQT